MGAMIRFGTIVNVVLMFDQLQVQFHTKKAELENLEAEINQTVTAIKLERDNFTQTVEVLERESSKHSELLDKEITPIIARQIEEVENKLDSLDRQEEQCKNKIDGLRERLRQLKDQAKAYAEEINSIERRLGSP